MLDLSLTVVIWGFSFVLAKKALNSFTPFELVTLRLFLGGLAAFALFRFSRREKKTWGKSDWRSAAIIGVFEFAGTYLLYTWSLIYLPSGVVGALTLMTPIFAYLIGLGFGVDRLSGKAFLATTLSFAGAALALPLEQILSNLKLEGAALFGVLLITVSNMFFALGNVLITKMEMGNRWSNQTTVRGLLIGSGVSALSLPFTPHTPLEHFAEPSSWLLPAYLGFVATGVGFFLWNRGVQQVRSTRATMIGNFKGPLAVVWGAVILGEPITPALVAGVVLLMVATQVLPRQNPVKNSAS